jgi:hypothetical protein
MTILTKMMTMTIKESHELRRNKRLLIWQKDSNLRKSLKNKSKSLKNVKNGLLSKILMKLFTVPESSVVMSPKTKCEWPLVLAPTKLFKKNSDFNLPSNSNSLTMASK